MTLLRWRSTIIPLSALLFALLLVGCSSGTPQVQMRPTATPLPPTPTAGPGQAILDGMANKLNSASTLHGVFDANIIGQAFNGTINTEQWNAKPDKNRTVVLQSTVPQFAAGTTTVSNGKQRWQYDPTQNVVYTGSVTATGSGTPSTGIGGGGGQSQFLLNLVQTVFTHSRGTLVSSSDTVNGQSVYDIHVVPQSSSNTGTNTGGTGAGAGTGGVSGFNYSGEVYIDKTTQLPVKMNLNIQGIGNVLLTIPTLVLNSAISASTFTFVVPSGVKQLPLSALNATPDTGSLTFAQAQQQAGYHLLSIPGSQATYVLNGVNALGAPGNQTYTLNYMKGNVSFTLAEGKPLANLPTSGSQVRVRGTTGTLSGTGNSTTLAWTEHGVGIRITGPLSTAQLQSIANLLV